MKKVVLVVCDGLSDRPIPEFGRKTPLEQANTPNLDKLAQMGISGAMNTIDIGVCPGSDTAHLSLLGYDPNVYYTGRGPYECAGIDMDIQKGDLCFRVNAGTVDDTLKVIDRRAGRIDDTSFIEDLFNGMEIDGVKFILKSSVGHRLGLIMRSLGEAELSADITEGDPHVANAQLHEVKAIDNDDGDARFTAEVLNKFLKITQEKLKEASENKKREEDGKLPANYLLVRGQGKNPNLPSFKEKYGLNSAGIAGGALYKGLAKAMGMDVLEVPSATGKPKTDLLAKTNKVVEKYENYDFFFVHFKGADTLGEDGDFEGKMKFIEEQIDPAIGPLLGLENSMIVVTADHSTPCELKSHSGDDVPVTIYSESVRDDDVSSFSERECAKGRLGHIKGENLMPIIIDLMGLAELFGA